ncbi:DUF2493 domain-containing protein [Aquamicrobium sp. LC103]|nr:DUF2493 domain-containing protein [Aquamicrobium sp. LC103]
MELFRDLAAEAFEHHTGSAWRPRTGSMVNHCNLTAAMIDSCDLLAAKRRAETEVMLPVGPKVALTGAADFNDHRLIWAKLDLVHAKYPDMVSCTAARRVIWCRTSLVVAAWPRAGADPMSISTTGYLPFTKRLGLAAASISFLLK